MGDHVTPWLGERDRWQKETEASSYDTDLSVSLSVMWLGSAQGAPTVQNRPCSTSRMHQKGTQRRAWPASLENDQTTLRILGQASSKWENGSRALAWELSQGNLHSTHQNSSKVMFQGGCEERIWSGDISRHPLLQAPSLSGPAGCTVRQVNAFSQL